MGINGVNIAGYKSNTLDVGAIHAGALMGIMNTFANLTGVVAPFVTKLIAATVSLGISIMPCSLVLIVIWKLLANYDFTMYKLCGYG